MNADRFDAYRALEELRKLLEVERESRWFARWGIRNMIVAKIKYRLPSLYIGIGERPPAMPWQTERPQS